MFRKYSELLGKMCRFETASPVHDKHKKARREQFLRAVTRCLNAYEPHWYSVEARSGPPKPRPSVLCAVVVLVATPMLA